MIKIEGLKKSLVKEGFCFACLTGEYPSEAGKKFLESFKR
jgi:glutamine phosphoribosylpyrophosphate amidotransferase